MNELIQKIVTQVQNAGGSLSYKAILDATDYPQRGQLPNALRQARAEGKLTQTVELVDGKIAHTYHIGTV